PQGILTIETIKKILDPHIGESPDPLRESISKFDNIPDGVPNISTYLKFVDREEEVKQLMMNMEKLYYLVKNLKQFPEPKKEIRFPTAVGTAGKGKTTFARRAYEKSEIYSKVVKPEVVDAVRKCHEAGRSFRIACDQFSSTVLRRNADATFGTMLLYEALKYRLP
ncbi:8680_t:CDS:1, partial [Funneliformis geosporum]